MPSCIEDYEVLGTVGSGSYGTCKKIRRRKDGKILVWKEIDYGSMTETEKQMLVSEVNLLRELKHDNIVRYYDRIIDKASQTIYIVMEYCEGGDLSSLISKYKKEGKLFEEEFVWKVLTQCVLALKECHSRKDGKSVLHRDLKPANVFLDGSKNVKLGDFGLARVLHHETSFAETFVGTPYYMSPEQMNHLSYNEKSDIWSLGCVVYELCSLHPPFLAANQKELAVKIRIGNFARLPRSYSSDLSQLITRMLSVESYLRPSIESLLAHPQVRQRAAAISGTAVAVLPVQLPALDVMHRGLTEHTSANASCWPDELKRLHDSLVEREARLHSREAELEDVKRQYLDKLRALEGRESALMEKEQLFEEERGSYLSALAMLGHDVVSTGACQEQRPPLAPCITKVRKPESPSKKVSFKVFECGNKENLSTNNLVLESTMERQKHAELKERLHRAKIRAIELRSAEIESKIRSSTLLAMR